MKYLDIIKKEYDSIRDDITARLKSFKKVWENSSDEELFLEFTFCLLTPQSKAESCWETVELLKSNNMIFLADRDSMAQVMNKVRFRNNKASYIVEARKKFFKDGKFMIKDILAKIKDVKEKRDWLVRNVKGMGYKEASHFLRNIGFGNDIAILDRHILKNLKLLKVIDEIPLTLSKKLYTLIEDKMRYFSKKISIPMAHLDLILWYHETRKIFK